MKHFRLNYLTKLAMCCAFFAFAFASCSSEDEPDLPTPTISIEGGNTMEVRRGEAIDVTLNLNTQGSNRELVVYRDGGVLEVVPLQAATNSFTYSNQSVPSSALEGQEFEYEFAVFNTQGTSSERVSLTVLTLAYEAITIGGETLYDVEIPEDGIIEDDVRFISGRNYHVGGTMSFASGTTLTIQEGVTIYVASPNGTLSDIVINDGASAEIIGTAQSPVVFTSVNTLDGSEESGDWGVFNIRGTGGTSNSGTYQFIRFEYGNARNFRLQNVGSGTTIDHIQVFKAAGEGIMPTDGTVNMSYLVTTDCESGGFRIGDAYQGRMQFGIAMISRTWGDNSEVDIRETASPVLANFTVIGPGAEASNTSGIRMRANSSGKIYNTIIADFPRRGLRLNDNVNITDLDGATVFAHSFIFNVPSDPYRDDTANGNPFRGFVDGNGEFQNPFFNNVTGFDGNQPILTTIAGIGTNSFIPTSAQSSAFNPNSISGFASAAFVGAIQNAENDWTRGWVKNPDGSVR
ncbi:hypothetical protein MM239_19050 [Belliella sp. DSM 111904]|uniref:Uncharacterized protein n=1 Tax=Belliella filtrata TaxID=2923435 RepID=A0ABS9V4Z4_9BACT|nr:hypothetical protein [Belliella filtrata]MCH7411494.1 hypothetical protein [Belliella filtrata]